MNGVGQSGERKSYRVILLLVVGLTAFSSAMKELNLLREFSRDTSDMVASWSRAMTPQAPPEVVVPAEIPPVPETVEICESSHAEPAEPVELAGGVAPAEVKSKDVGKTFVAERSTRRGAQAVATLRSHRSADIEMMELRKQVRRAADLKVMILADSDGEAEFAVPTNFEFKVPKAKTWDRQIIIKPEQREILRSLNRTFSLRSAG
ncbi:MAG TPA: hypothetical protein VFM63_12310 [Pyrinomonadaceae bacterium]|nr:hypothetical protein [Pyrinomonadaceae bacterium]